MVRIARMAILMSILTPLTLWADNLSYATAYSLKPNGTPGEGYLDATKTERWYWFGAVIGRSYCVETQGAVHFDAAAASDIDTALTVYRSDGTTVIVSNDDDLEEPNGGYTSRACYLAPVTEYENIKVTQSSMAPAGSSMSFRVRVVDTTMFSDWFFTGGDYHSYTLLRNTTHTSVPYTINWRSSSGAIVQSVTGTLPGNGSTYFDGANYAPVTSAVFGTVEIAHSGSPDAITASTTVMSSSTGLSFDAPFTQRRSW